MLYGEVLKLRNM